MMPTMLPPTPRRARALLLALAALGAAGCTKRSEKYCALNPEDERCGGVTADAAPTGCQLDEDCAEPGLGVCVGGACVQCTAARPEACSGDTPVCDADQTCRACAAHAECASDVCTPEGRCVATADVAYVVEGATGTTCTQAEPCGSLEDALEVARQVIKVSGVIDEPGLVLLDGVTVTVYGAPGARIASRGDTLLDVRGSTGSVALRDLALTGTADRDKPIVRVTAGGRLDLAGVTVEKGAGLGLLADSGEVRITRSQFLLNSSGGLLIPSNTATTTTAFDITGSVFAHNGDARIASPSDTGGVALLANTAGSRFVFNTVAFNQSGGGVYRGGVQCAGALVDATGNVVYRNAEANGAGGLDATLLTQRNVIGCMWGTTFVLDTHPANLGFASPIVAPFDFHLTAATPAELIDTGGACTGVDLDGTPRPLGMGCDLGADEDR